MTESTMPESGIDIRRRLTGLEFFQRIAAGELPPPALVALLGLKLVEAEDGRVVFAGTVTEQYYNGLGVAHGGWAATIIDSAVACAINSTQPAGRMFTTVELKINYTRPLTRETGEVRCTGTVIHIGTRTATAEARVVDRDGLLYAHGSTTCLLVT
jgi:uncharacterized protein (TIGR00369 family)